MIDLPADADRVAADDPIEVVAARRFHEAHRAAAADQGLPDLGPWDELPAAAKIVTIVTFEKLLNALTAAEWLDVGDARGFVGKRFCGTHDGPPYTAEEAAVVLDTGDDPCTPSVRVIIDGGRADG